MGDMDIDISEMVKQIHLHLRVRGVRRAVIRIKLMTCLIRLAAWVGGFGGITVEEDNDGHTD